MSTNIYKKSSTSSPVVWEKFKETIEKYSLITPNDRILLAVSGGPDSMCMLHLFHRLNKQLQNLKIYVVYIDHGIRPKEIRNEIKLIKLLCSSLNIPFITRKIKIKGNNSGFEFKAHKKRYNVFLELAKKYKCNKISTGHNINDMTETVIFNILRSPGAEGLKGIPIKRDITKKIAVIRPLLKIRRDEIINYLTKNGIRYSTDSTNLSDKYTRNYIRHKIIPELEKINPQIHSHIYNLVEWNNFKEDYFDKLTEKIVIEVVKKRGNVIKFDLLKIFKYNKYLQYKVFKETVINYIKTQNIHNLIEEIINFIDRDDIKKLVLGKIKLIKTEKELIIENEY